MHHAILGNNAGSLVRATPVASSIVYCILFTVCIQNVTINIAIKLAIYSYSYIVGSYIYRYTAINLALLGSYS